MPQKQERRPNCRERGCWHTHCTSAVDLALEMLAAARSFGVEQLALLTEVNIYIPVESWGLLEICDLLAFCSCVLMLFSFGEMGTLGF